MTRKKMIQQVKREMEELRRKVEWILHEQSEFLEKKRYFDSYFKTGEEGAMIRRAEQASDALDDVIALMEQTIDLLGEAEMNQ